MKEYDPNLTPLQFLQGFYGCEDCAVSYRITEYASLIVSEPMRTVVQIIEKDIAEMSAFLEKYGLADKAKDVAFSLWEEKRLVKF